MMKTRFKGSEKRSYILTSSLLLIALIGVFLWPHLSAAAPPGITETEIVLGQSCALTGPTKALGLGMRDGALAYFKELNSKGGINGRKIRLVSHDDGYEPEACATNTNRLIDQDLVFLLFGYVGTPTATAAVPIATKKMCRFLPRSQAPNS
jgi:ABC-type branched-subunit amino acid transport system substrate-binding protein